MQDEDGALGIAVAADTGITWLSTATLRPLRPLTVSRRSDCTPEVTAASTGHSASADRLGPFRRTT